MKFGLLLLLGAPVFRIEPAARELHGVDAMQQFLAIATFADGAERDVTATVRWGTSSPQVCFRPNKTASRRSLPRSTHCEGFR